MKDLPRHHLVKTKASLETCCCVWRSFSVPNVYVSCRASCCFLVHLQELPVASIFFQKLVGFLLRLAHLQETLVVFTAATNVVILDWTTVVTNLVVAATKCCSSLFDSYHHLLGMLFFIFL